jgi:hypothetical protein
MILVSLFNPKFAKVLAARSRELRVGDTKPVDFMVDLCAGLHFAGSEPVVAGAHSQEAACLDPAIRCGDVGNRLDPASTL